MPCRLLGDGRASSGPHSSKLNRLRSRDRLGVSGANHQSALRELRCILTMVAPCYYLTLLQPDMWID